MKHVIYHDFVQEIKFKHTVKSFRHIETLSLFSSLVSTLEFVLGRDVQLPLESVLYPTQVILEAVVLH